MNTLETKRMSRGATRNASATLTHASKFSPVKIFLVGLKFSGLMVLLASTWLLIGSMDRWLDRPVGRVAVEGDFNFLSQDKIAALVTRQVEAGFFRMDLDALQVTLQSQDWIDSVRISRQWPDELLVRVIEQRPIARWRDTGFLNQRGELIRVSKGHPVLEQLSGLSKLSGPEGFEAQVMRQYQFLSKLLAQDNLKLTELVLSNTGRWQLQLNQTLLVELGRDHIDEKIQRLLWIYERRLKSRESELKAIDLRYPNAVAVRFNRKDDENNNGINTEDNALNPA